MRAFFLGALWALVVVLWGHLAWPWVAGDAVSAQSGGEGTAVSIEDEPYAYWKCWRTGTTLGQGFTNRAQGAGGGGFATPYLPDWSVLASEGRMLPEDGLDKGRWQQTRSQYLDARFYRTPGLRDGNYNPLSPGNAAVFKPFGEDGSDKSLFGPRDARDILPQWNPFVVAAAPRISKLEVTWDTHAGDAGEGSIDEVLRGQQEQVADTETAEHLVYRQGPYRGSSTVSSTGVLSSYAPVYEVGDLGSAHPDVGYRVQTGFEEDQVMVLSGTSYTSSAGGNTTTTYNISSQPRNVTNEVSITNRNSAAHPEVNAAQVTVQAARVVLNQIGTTGYHDDSVAPPKPIRALQDPSGSYHSIPGYQFATVELTGGNVPACFIAAVPDQHGNSVFRREYRGYCWMVRAGATPSATDATQSTAGLGVPLPDGMDVGVGTSDVRASLSHFLDGWGPHFTIPVYETGPEPAADDSVLDANTPAERQDALDPVVADDGPNDALIVAIDLKSDYRRDPRTDYNLSDGSGNNGYRWKLFGDDRLESRYHMFSDGATYQVGYNQSYMVPPFLGTKNDIKKNERILPYLYDDDGGVEGLGLESMFLWPVRLDEMNYYLFRVPGFTHDHLRDRGHIMNLAYAHSTGVIQDGINANFLGLTLRLTSQPMGEAAPIPADAEGTSGRTDFGFTAHHVNPFTDGNVYYPFYDLDIYRNETVGNSYGGSADAGYSSNGSGVLLSRSMLVKAGVTAPIDRGDGADQYGNNATFRFQIEEGLPVGVPEGGGREDVLDRLGFSPSYLAYLASQDPQKRSKDPLEQAWPNARINPDDTHLLLVTFYEGRIAGEWRIQNALDVPLVGNVGLPAQVAWGTDKLGLTQELGSVPRFQFRRVMCRVLVPADGVVTPASGFEGVKEKLGEVRDKVVGALAGVVDRLIGWLEDLPKQLMETGTKVAAGATCEGAGFIDTLGDNVPARHESSSAGGADVGLSDADADVGLSGVEADSYLGKEQCRQVSQEVTARTGDCTDVGRTVDDPACRGVPSVGFRAWRVISSGELQSYGTEGRHDYYATRWVPRSASDYEDVLLVPYATDTGDGDWVDRMESNAISLPLSANIDLGVGAARLEFDYDKIDLLYGRPIGSGVDGYLQSRETEIRWDEQDSADFLRRRSSGRFDGYILYVRPDPKAGWYHNTSETGKTLKQRLDEFAPRTDEVQNRAAVLTSPGAELRFVLPLYYLQFGGGQLGGKTAVRRVQGFDVGPVLGHRKDAKCTDSHIGILSQRASKIGDRLGTGLRYVDAAGGVASGRFECDGDPNEHKWEPGNQKVAFVGASDWAYLDAYLSRLWYLGDGYRYQFALSAYRGMPGIDDSWVEGPRSDWVTVSGGAELACRDKYVIASRWAADANDPRWVRYAADVSIPRGFTLPDGSPATSHDYYQAVFDRYDCRELLASGGALERFSDTYSAYRKEFQNAGGVTRLEPTVERGVLGAQAAPDLSGIYESTSLVGSRVCGNFWNGTPSGQTWNSPVTRTIWHVS